MKIVIFGASGDLSKRKIFPSLSKLNLKSTRIIAYSRSDLSATFQSQLEEFHSYDGSFFERIDYVKGDYKEISLCKEEEYIFYFSVPPTVYVDILNGLSAFKGGSIAIEKPFGACSSGFNNIVVFKQEHPQFNIVLIDHYLLKPLCLMLPLIRREIVLDESVFRIDFISKEELGVEGRLYFDATGIVKDIVQNHLLELYSTLLCDSSEGMRNEENGRVEILKHTNITDKYAFGQYKGYEEEIGTQSKTETFAHIFVHNDLQRYKDILFSFTAGKGMDEKRTEIRIQYKREHYKRVIETTLKTVKYNNEDNFSLSQLTVSSNEDNLVNKAHIKDVTLVVNLTPMNNVTLFVEVNDKVHAFNIFEKSKILEYFEGLYGKLDDHAVIFDALLNKRDVPSTALEEGLHEWRIFGDLMIEPSFFYEKGISFPEEAEILLE